MKKMWMLMAVFSCDYVLEMRWDKHCSEQHLDQGLPWKKQENGSLKEL